jgi:hypothetical protein
VHGHLLHLHVDHRAERETQQRNQEAHQQQVVPADAQELDLIQVRNDEVGFAARLLKDRLVRAADACGQGRGSGKDGHEQESESGQPTRGQAAWQPAQACDQ